MDKFNFVIWKILILPKIIFDGIVLKLTTIQAVMILLCCILLAIALVAILCMGSMLGLGYWCIWTGCLIFIYWFFRYFNFLKEKFKNKE